MRSLVAASTLCLLGCTSLLGVDGEYRVDSGEGGASSTTDAVASVSVGTGQGGDGATTASSGAGGSGAGGFGGEAPFPPGTCERCAVVFTEEPIEEASQPRLAHLSDIPRLSYVSGGLVTFRENGEDAEVYPATDPSSPLALVNDDFTAPYRLYTSEETLFGAGEPFFAGVARPFIHGARTESRVLVAATIQDQRPALLDCEESNTADPCDIVAGSLCGTSMPDASGRNVAVDRIAGTVHFGRICGDVIEVSQPGADPPWSEAAEGAEELAIAVAPAGLYVLAILRAGEDDAAVRIFPPGQEPITHAVPGARAPAMILMDPGVVGTFATPWGLAMVSCDTPESCTFGMLVAEAMDGAAEPSLGVFLDGQTRDPWIAWQRNDTVHHGRLGAPPPEAERAR